MNADYRSEERADQARVEQEARERREIVHSQQQALRNANDELKSD